MSCRHNTVRVLDLKSPLKPEAIHVVGFLLAMAQQSPYRRKLKMMIVTVNSHVDVLEHVFSQRKLKTETVLPFSLNFSGLLYFWMLNLTPLNTEISNLTQVEPHFCQFVFRKYDLATDSSHFTQTFLKSNLVISLWFSIVVT